MEKKYTEKQLEVINIDHGYNMVLAGPGCGKTDILAERVVRAYKNEGVSLSDMLCLTFTNRAARGMFERIQQSLENDSVDLFVGNIHRYCSHFLFEESASGVTGETSIMDEEDADEVLCSEITEKEIKELIQYREVECNFGTLISLDWYIINNFLGIDIFPTSESGMVKEPKARKIISDVRRKIYIIQHLMHQVVKKHPKEDYYMMDYLKNNLIKNGYSLFSTFQEACLNAKYDSTTYDQEDYTIKVLSLAYKYQEYKRRNDLLDFDDLLLYTYDAYFNDSQKEYKRYKWIQIDEIQDLSRFQLSLVDLLTNKDKDYVVLYLGDEQQAIYSFMGASLDSLNYLKERCANIYRLDKNFRSPKFLLDIYNEYAIKELNVDKDFLPSPQDNKEAGFYDVCLHLYSSEEEEADRIYDAILPYLRDEKRENERTALLVRWNKDANVISDKLKDRKIPHFKISGSDSFLSVHMKTLLAHLNAVSNDFNLIAWSRILKQTYAVDTYKEARKLIEEMRKIGMCPSDLLRDSGTYLSEFVNYYDNEEIVLFDTETTGTDVFNDDIVQIAAYKIRKGKVLPDSLFDIIIQLAPGKTIPPELGKEKNPLIDKYNNATHKYSHYEGLKLFMEYIGDSILMGHNVNFDYNILKYNLQKYCGYHEDDFHARTIDTLKLAHLVSPRQRKYKLGYLVDRFSLISSKEKEVTFHNADEDIKATLLLADYCRKEAENHLTKQSLFFDEKKTKQVISEWKEQGYKDCYLHTKNNLFVLLPDDTEHALIREMKYISQELKNICEFRLVDSFENITDFLSIDVISKKSQPNALTSHLSNHLMDLSTFREAEMCSSTSFKEKLFVSTVHKAKGLEFENVLVMCSIVGRYPHFAHNTYEQQEEDKRLFYVAISRAMKRLVVSGISRKMTPFINSIMHNFTLRYELLNSNNIRAILEIGSEILRVKRIVNNLVKYQDYNISRMYKYDFFNNQYDIKELIMARYSRSDIFNSIENIIKEYGGYSI